MGTKSKKSRKILYVSAFVLCVLGFLTATVGFIAAAQLNSYMGYGDPYFLQQNGYGSFGEWMEDSASLAVQLMQMEKDLKVWVIISVTATIISLISMIYLAVAAGQRDEKGTVVLCKSDKVFTEIQVAAVLLIFFIGGKLFSSYVYGIVSSVYGLGYYSLSPFDLFVEVAFAVLLGGAATSVGLALILSCIRKIKAGEFAGMSLCSLIFRRLYTEVYKGGSTMRKVVLIAVLICLLSATMFLAPVIFIVILVFAPKWVHKYDRIKEGIKEMNGGNFDYKIQVEGDDELDQLAEGINKIAEATSIAVQNELTNQRMKTDLISNVSHDLKTPLTSMVTYIDLLKTEGLDSPNAPEYLEVLEQKTERLRQLTEDLFEAAKASSGATPVRMSRVDLLSLLNQGLGELNERVEASNLFFIVNAENERYFVKADGQLLWRVISNLLNNVLKYSQEGTRVYIDFFRDREGNEEVVRMEIKNISRQALNMDPSELMERFKRGDEARTTEGSGLGLAIAKDLMKLMNGNIQLEIDGDLFKARISLEAASEEEPIVEPVDLEDDFYGADSCVDTQPGS